MNCFYHREKPALGLCKSCGRGICEECLAEIPNGLACKGRCEERASIISGIIENANAVRQISNKQIKNNAFFYLAIGLGLIAFAAWTWSYKGTAFRPVVYYSSIFGFISLLFGVYTLRRKMRYPELK